MNHKVIHIAQRNINSGFDLAKSLTKAKNLAEIIELQATYWREQFGVLANQAEEVRTLSTQVAADAAKPIKSQMARGMDGRTHCVIHRTSGSQMFPCQGSRGWRKTR